MFTPTNRPKNRIPCGGWFLGLVACAAQLLGGTEPILPPGVPEPGLILWGTVSSTTAPDQPLPIEQISWSVSDGGRIANFATTTQPPARIRTIEGIDHFVLQVPFDTRRFGEVSLADPSASGRTSFELNDTPTALICRPTVNGAPATVLSVARVPAPGPDVSLQGPDPASRGLVLRVDLAISTPSGTYEEWAESIWGSATHPDARRDADPDGDGVDNEGEFEAGTDPRDPASALRILQLTLSTEQDSMTIEWRSVATRRYQVESAPEANGPWTALGPKAEGDEATTRLNLGLEAQAPQGYYRVRTAP